jgi:hypothetical protein
MIAMNSLELSSEPVNTRRQVRLAWFLLCNDGFIYCASHRTDLGVQAEAQYYQVSSNAISALSLDVSRELYP